MRVSMLKWTASFAGQLALAGALIASLPTAAGAKDVGAYGGDGGSDFRSECRPPDALIGINLRSGTGLDAVVAICIPLNAERTEWAGQAYEPTQYWGGGGGGYQKIACQPGDVVKRLRVSTGLWDNHIFIVKYIAIECKDLGSNYTYRVAQQNVNQGIVSTKWMDCKKRIGSGIYGWSGQMIDRIGLSCE